jgi:hypothetical protein
MLLDEHIGHVVARIRELKVLEKELRTLREQCVSNQVATDCGILSGLERAARLQGRSSADHGHAVHVHGVHQQLRQPKRS